LREKRSLMNIKQNWRKKDTQRREVHLDICHGVNKVSWFLTAKFIFSTCTDFSDQHHRM
jgi:hypothetical protein